jgi:hypothetical protein
MGVAPAHRTVCRYEQALNRSAHAATGGLPQGEQRPWRLACGDHRFARGWVGLGLRSTMVVGRAQGGTA